jgi:hypothetical protein
MPAVRVKRRVACYQAVIAHNATKPRAMSDANQEPLLYIVREYLQSKGLDKTVKQLEKEVRFVSGLLEP